jgi:hypothetical protein
MSKKAHSHDDPPCMFLLCHLEIGVIFGGSKLLSCRSLLQSSNKLSADCSYWLPNSASMANVSTIAQMIDSTSNDTVKKWKASIGTSGSSGMVSMQEYLEALAWPKDSDTGLRYGFPGTTIVLYTCAMCICLHTQPSAHTC